MQQQLAAQPGLLKDLAGYLAHTHTNSSIMSGNPAACTSSSECDTTRSSSSGNHHHPAHTSSPEADNTPSSSQQGLEAAGGVLAHLLACCNSSMPPLPYQDLAPALYAALQQRLVCLPALAQALLLRHTTSMITDQQLLCHVLDAAEQGEAPAAAVLTALAPLVLQVLEPTHPTPKLVHDRVTALLAGGTAAGGAFLAAALQLEGGTLWGLPGMVEAACSGLLAACREAAAVDASTTTSSSQVFSEKFPCLVDLPPAHAVLLQYLRGLVGVVLHLATHLDPHQSAKLAEVAGPLVPALAEALTLLLESLQMPQTCNWLRRVWVGGCKRPYHDAAWAALLALSECPETAALVAALLQHQPGLLQALAASWDHCEDHKHCEEPANTAARLARCLLLKGGISGQEERQHHQQLLVAAVSLWDKVYPNWYHGQVGMVVMLVQLPHGPQAVVHAPRLLNYIFQHGLLGPVRGPDAWARLLVSQEFATGLVAGVREGNSACLAVVGCVWSGNVPAHTQALLAMPGLGDALVRCCSRDGATPAVDGVLGSALRSKAVQAYLAQQPVLLQALAARLSRKPEQATMLISRMTSAYPLPNWVLQHPVLLDQVVHALVVARPSGDVSALVSYLLHVGASLVCESLLRQPSAVAELLRVGVRRRGRLLFGVGGIDAQQLLLEGLVNSSLAPRVLAMLPSLLEEGDADLSLGVFTAMHLIQTRLGPGSLNWCQELASTSSRGGEVLCAEGQLQALYQGLEEMKQATAAAAAATRQLEEQRQAAVVAAGIQAAVRDQLQGAGQVGSGRVSSHVSPGAQQQGQQASAPQALGKHSGAAVQQAVAGAGSQPGAGGRPVPGRAVTAPAAAAAGVPHGHGGQGAVAPPPPKRTRHFAVTHVW
jgi:hypothetical protein